jgi:hypothetical protein
MAELVKEREHHSTHHRCAELLSVREPLAEQRFQVLGELVTHDDVALPIPRRVDGAALGPHDGHRLW